MLVNIEHVAQRNFSPARTTARRWLPRGRRRLRRGADRGRRHQRLAVPPGLIDQGPARYGVNFISERSTFQSGETGGWSALPVAKVSVMQAPPLYHTTGEVLDVISEPGLERIARFLAQLVAQADQAPARHHQSLIRGSGVARTPCRVRSVMSGCGSIGCAGSSVKRQRWAMVASTRMRFGPGEALADAHAVAATEREVGESRAWRRLGQPSRRVETRWFGPEPRVAMDDPLTHQDRASPAGMSCPAQ